MEKRNTLVRRDLLPTVVLRKESVNNERHEKRSKQEGKYLKWVFNLRLVLITKWQRVIHDSI